jgi:hypothetical protein
LTGIAADLSVSVRRLASAKTGIPAAQIVLAATHSHTAPDYTRDLYEYLGSSPEEGRNRYSARLIRGIVDAILQADAMSWGLSRTLAGAGDSLPVDVQVISLGPELAIVRLSGEVFVDLGLAIKRASPFRTTLVVELCNCVETVYVPTRVAHAGGSYEVTNSTVKPGAAEILAETAIRLLREAASGSQPLPPSQ